MKEMSILPVQFTLMIRTFGGICILLVPARSAPAYEHQLQQNATILGEKVDFLLFGLAFPGAVVLGVIVVKNGPPSTARGDNSTAIKLPASQSVQTSQ
jgi:hypothetical protein